MEALAKDVSESTAWSAKDSGGFPKLGVILGLYRDNGKNGSYYLGFRDYGLQGEGEGEMEELRLRLRSPSYWTPSCTRGRSPHSLPAKNGVAFAFRIAGLLLRNLM